MGLVSLKSEHNESIKTGKLFIRSSLPFLKRFQGPML